MESYANLGGDSGVVAYELGLDSITVQFSDGAIYAYTNDSAGASIITRMKSLAREGQGLNAFINMRARKLYSRKLR